jgi:hypothetical protein
MSEDEEKPIGEPSGARRGASREAVPSGMPDSIDREALDSWQVAEPPAGFADRVMAAREAAASEPAPRPGRKRAIVGALFLLSSAAVWLWMVSWGNGGGQVAAAARTSVKLGSRGIAVAEAGARLDWKVERGEALVEQQAGNVFYRVEKGGAFVVATPAGEVRVQGTCFRVEVDPMLSRQAVIAAGVGAVAATTILVTVYEGRVLLANEKGKTVLAAGEKGEARAGETPSVMAENAAMQQKSVAAVPIAPPAEGVTREQLLERDREQRVELEKLRTRVQQLETQATTAGKDGKKKDERPFFDPSKEELQQMAKECKLKWDVPSIGLQPQTVGQKRANELGLSEQERTEINRVRAELNTRVLKELRTLYVEVTGDKTAADSLAPQALENEILSKSPEQVVEQIFYKISHERAGLQAPPANLQATPAAERLMRLLTGLGDEYEQKLGAAIGPDRARQLRAENNGWDSRSQASVGCPGE